ncbi:DEAD box helicase [Tribonema minus]|uniref:DEAD box helicase n=1 Tax=Tribonema minus TaxID=303371 RepID=A0A836CEI1_9STRA|nr:DEAD box helicase [Tribonema minus]
MSISDQPFASPASAPEATGEWSSLGLLPEVQGAVDNMGFATPSSIQRIAIPQITSGGNMVVAAATGSGKTLAYLLPVINALKSQEQLSDATVRKPGRPRALVLVPTRELAAQVLGVTKQVAHTAKVSSCGIFGGEDYGKQKRELAACQDVVVGSPGRLLKHRDQGTLFLSQVTHVVIDEVDTMLTQGFGPDITALVKPLMRRQGEDAVQFVLVSATVTAALRRLLEAGEFPKVRMVETRDVHRALPNMKHAMVDCKGRDKLSVLLEVLAQHGGSGSSAAAQAAARTLIFCNTVASARAVDHALRDAGVAAAAYHGEVPSAQRAAALAAFRAGSPPRLVATDVAARGLDLPEVGHVIMFDFPLNPVDYLHRSGRTARMGARGRVTSLLAKRDRVLAAAIEAAVLAGRPLDALTARRTDYLPGGKLAAKSGSRGGGGGGSGSSARRTGSSDASARRPRSAAGGGGRGAAAGGGGGPRGKGVPRRRRRGGGGPGDDSTGVESSLMLVAF